GQVPTGADLYESISKICTEEDVKIGKVTALGAVSQAAIAYYDQKKKKYQPITFKKHLEILNCTGNVSLKDGKPFVHVHATFSDRIGNVFGGHLTPGTIVFACEVTIEELEGKGLDRKLDDKTGLNLWGKKSVLV
ncbi:MAG: PPC domain-containing DNA-binding protein, partial [Bacteroidota bacterium]